MNKKVLTLCAGVLLVGGSTVFTVNALNAGNVKAQSAYVMAAETASEEGTVTGYEISTAEKSDAAAIWTVAESSDGTYELTLGNGFGLNANAELVKDGTTSFAIGENGVISGLVISSNNTLVAGSEGTQVALFDTDGNVVTNPTAEAKYYLAAATTKEIISLEITTDVLKFDADAEESTLSLVKLGEGDFSEGVSEVTSGTVFYVGGTTSELKTSVEGGSNKFLALDATKGAKEVESDSKDDETIFKLQEDGSFKAGSYTLQYNGETVYAYTSSSEKLTPEGLTSGQNTTVILGVDATKEVVEMDESSVVKADPETANAEAPGASLFEEADGVYAELDGTIKFVAGISSSANISAPFSIEAAQGVELPKGLTGSWTLKDGKLVNLAAQKADGLKTTPDGKIYYGDEDGNLVAEDNAVEVTFNENGLVVAGTIYSVTLKTTGEALPLVTTDDDQKNSVNTGDIVTIKSNNYFTPDMYKVVVGEKSNGNYTYSFIKLDEHGKEVEPTAYLTYTENGEEITDFIGKKYDGSFSLQTEGGTFVTIDQNGNLVKADGQESLTLIAADDLVQPDVNEFNVDQLLDNFGTKTSFGVTLKHKYVDEDGDDATKDITVGNVFADAELIPYEYVGGELKALTEDDTDETFLLKSGDRFIVLETTEDSEWTSINDDLKDGGYKFTTLGEKAMLEMMEGDGELNNKTYAPYFTFNYDNNTNENGEGKAVYNIEVKNFDKSHRNYVSSFEVKSGAQKGVYLTVTAEKAYWVAAELGANNLVKAKSDHSPLNYQYVNIQFANHESIKESNGKLLNGRVLGAEVTTADASEFLFSKPEGQWIVNVTAAGNANTKLDKDGVANLKDATGFTFINRESGREYAVSAMYYLGDNKYAVSSTTKQFAASPATRDTLIITKADVELKNNTIQRDGYADLKAIDIQDEQFNLLVASAEQDYYVGENHSSKSHFLGLSHDDAAAVNWRIVPLTTATEYDEDGILMTVSDSIYIHNYPQYFGAGDKLFSYSDTVAIVSYALQNTSNGEYLTYEDPQTTTIQSMICDPDFKSFKTTKDVTAAYRFVLKEKANGLYNIVSVNGNVIYEKEDKDGNKYWAKGDKAYTLGDKKLYGATTLTKQGAIEVEDIYEDINSNDLFKVQQVAAPEYRELAQGDTIRIFREENDFDTMYEDGSFLNLGNSAQLSDMNPALYVDTAYVNRGTNNRYQYLLAVNVTRVDEELCNHVPATHPKIHPDTTYGRFLVNLIDSAVVEYANGAVHNNKFINDTEADETFVKLGFVWGYRTEDHLYLTEGNDFTKVKDVIDLSTNDFNIAKFAFRYVNPTNADDQSFKIQTRYIDYATAIKDYDEAIEESHNNGYLKTINGVVVVVPGYARGEEFNLAAETRVPTANEEISAENAAVSVVATDGAVIIKGAAGKNVVIATILGKVVANETVNSDNETIAVPAGIAVVSVDGESFKVVVK